MSSITLESAVSNRAMEFEEAFAEYDGATLEWALAVAGGLEVDVTEEEYLAAWQWLYDYGYADDQEWFAERAAEMQARQLLR
ncbi:MAG TPA: hypothetical protein VKZ99_03170 [Gammaproteobacteria bacterium]|nr:hypothetical protein [Gammaproteobacteria bacterium]